MTSRGKLMVQLALGQNASWMAPNRDAEEILPLNDNEGRLDEPETESESEHSDHETDSEQSVDDEIDDGPSIPSEVLIGKDKTTRWRLNVNSRVRRGRENIVSHLPGVKAIAKDAKTRIECWKLFFSDQIIDHIVKYTNIYLDKLRPFYSRSRDCRGTNPSEIFALLGLLYMAGVKKSQHLNVKELWNTDGSAPECFRATMSKERFLLLLRALRFDDINTRNERKVSDNLAPIREVFEDFNSKCTNNFQVGEYMTIDEMLESFRGRCKFRQYISNKPAKYGIKIYSLVDARVFYTHNMEIYPGRQPNGPYKYDNSAQSVVMRLAQPILGTGRNITMDNYFTSLPLAAQLLANKTTIVGTIRKNKRQIPVNFLSLKGRDTYSSEFAFLENTKGVLVSYKPKKSNTKNVLCFSTLHKDKKIDESTNELAKPEIITFYNLTKGGVDVVDQMKSNYSVSRVSCRWPLTVFFTLLNVGGINAHIIYHYNTTIIEERRFFLKNLALDLMKAHLLSRAQVTSMPVVERKRMKRIAGQEEDENPTNSGCNIPPEFCAYCPRRKNKKSKRSCRKCKKTVCNEHSSVICITCAEEHSE